MKTLTTGYEKKSFDNLFRQYYPRLTAYACLLVERETAEDITQDMFEHVWEHWDEISIHTSLESYLFRSVYNRCLNYIKRRKCFDRFMKSSEAEFRKDEVSYFNPDNNEIIRELFIRDIRKKVGNAINTLPDKMRRVFELSLYGDMKNKEIAALEGISQRTVENHISAAMKKLRSSISKSSIANLF